MSDTLTSQDGRFRLVVQNDGNLVTYAHDSTAVWASGIPDYDPGPLPVPPAPQPIPGDFTSWPRRGLSYYASLTDPRLDLKGFFAKLAEAGANLTRTWLMDAWAVTQGGPGQYNGYVPFLQYSNVWDLDRVNPAYLDRLRAYTLAANEVGVLPQFTGLELYTWSKRKAKLLWVPPQSMLWMQLNRQGLVYFEDDAFDTLATGGPHAWLGEFYRRIVEALVGLHYTVELGNEMPEKPLHERLRDLWRAAGYTGAISVNRQDDTPGQYVNMKIGQNYDLIAFHGKRDLNYLDENYHEEPTYRTFREFYDFGHYDPARIALSSDGCRKSTTVGDVYDYDALARVFKDGLARGFGIEHQSALKIRSFQEGRIDLNDLEVEWFRSL